MKSNYGIACMLGLFLHFPFGASATPINGIFVFGDSLSDQSNVSTLTNGNIPGTDYSNGRFSNGPVYTDSLAQSLGLPLTSAPIFPSVWSPGNGNNFAYGGVRTDGHRSGLPLGLNSQVSAFVNGVTTADSDSLYIVFAGANNIQDAIGVANDNPTEAQDAGPVNALSNALAMDLGRYQEKIADWRLVDFKVRITNGGTEVVVALPCISANAV